MEEQIPFVTNITGGPSTDGTAVCIVLTLADETTTKFSIGLAGLPSIIVYLLNQAQRASETCGIEQLEGSLKPFENLAVGVSRLAIGPSDDAENAMLELDIGHIALRFKLPIASLRALSDRVIQMTTRTDS